MKSVIIIACLLYTTQNAFAQNVGIGLIAPKARLHVADSSVLFTGPSNLPAVAGATPVIGAGNRLMWFSNKAAIRAGGVSGVQWDEINIGQYSTAFGRSTIASGQYATSLGVSNTVSGNVGASALGSNNTVSGNVATGIGLGLTAQSYNSMVIGRYNEVAGNALSWVSTDPLFVVGNGASAGAPNNAFTINKNGDAYFDAKAIINGNAAIGGNATISGNSNINGIANMNSDANILGTTGLFGPTNVYDSITIKNNKEIIAEKSAGTAPLINLVPLGIVKFRVEFDRTTFDNCNSSFTNISGNFISSGVGSCGDPTGFASFVQLYLYFDSAQAAPYKDIIAAPSVVYNAQGGPTTSYASQLTVTGTEVQYISPANKPYRFIAAMKSADWGTFGTYYVSGTVMFYGVL